MSSSNILHLRLDANTGTINLNHQIPIQDLTLVQVRVNMVTDLDALAYPSLGVQLGDLFGPSQINNSNTQNSYLPVFNGEFLINQYQSGMVLGLQKNVPRSFDYAVYALDGTLVPSAKFTSIDLIFNYGIGRIFN